MNHNVLLADDSLTIQKVIKITLANQPYDITDCSSDDELFQKLSVVKPKLVFLDFNLSEKYTGYELTAKIKSILPSAKVLLLLGTFDTVDDSAMEKCGASDKIVKPFDSNKFIAVCKQLIQAFGKEEISAPSVQNESAISMGPDLDSQWTVNHSSGQSFARPSEPEMKAAAPLNLLDKEISDWGMSVPGIIDDHESHEITVDLPPVIGEVKNLQAKDKYEVKFPNDDLDYPTMEELTNFSEPVKEEPRPAKSKLISIDTFNTKDYEIEHQISSMDETDVKSIQDQIRDEVEDNLWHADEFEELKKEVSEKIEAVKNTFQPKRNAFDESLFKPLDEELPQPVSVPGVNKEDILNELRGEINEMVRVHVKEYLDQMFKSNVEKISWEVIPDLAENIIRQELTKISTKIMSEPN